MRLTTWNVGMGFRKKKSALAALHSDVVVLQEVGRLDFAQDDEHRWIGNHLQKGLAVVGFNGFRISVHPGYDPRIEFVVPIEVTGPAEFLLFAVWVMRHRAATRLQERPNRWQILQALEAYEPLLLSRPSIVAGDFNNSAIWDRPQKADSHSLAVRKLSDLGLVSAYHTSVAAEQGKERHATLFWRRHQHSAFHIDYVWFPRVWLPGLKAVEIGDFATWVHSGLSDHVPLTVELDDAVFATR